MSWLSKAFKKLKKNVKSVGKLVAHVAVPGLLVHELTAKAIHKTGSLPFGDVLKAGFSVADPYSALKPKHLLKTNIAALKKGAPMIAVAAGLGGASSLVQQAIGEGEGFLAGSGGPTPIVGDTGEMASEPPTHPSPAIVVGAVAVVGLLLVLVYRKK